MVYTSGPHAEADGNLRGLGHGPSRADDRTVASRWLAGAVGLGGPDRRAASAAERARVNVTRAVKTARSWVRGGKCPPITRRATMTKYLLSVHSVEGEVGAAGPQCWTLSLIHI